MFKRCACPVSLTCIHTQHQAMWRRLLAHAVETLPIDRWHDRPTGEDLRARSIAIEVKHETLPANRTRLLAAPVDLLPVLAVDLLACSRRRHCSPTRDGQPVMTGHKCTTTKDRSRKKAVMAALWSFLLDRLDVERSILRFPSPLHASEGALRIVAKGNWKFDSFLWGGRFGRSLLCPGRAEKKTRGSCPPTRCLPVDRNKLGPDSWRDEKGVWYRTHRHTHGIKALWTARSTALRARDLQQELNWSIQWMFRPRISDKWKSLRLDLLEVDGMTALIHYERQRCKKVNLFAKKPLPRSFFQHVQTLCMPSFIDMHTHATPGHVTSFACSRNTSDRSLAWSRHRRRSTSTCAIDRDRGETWNTSGKPHAVACCTSRSTASTGSRSTGMQ